MYRQQTDAQRRIGTSSVTTTTSITSTASKYSNYTNGKQALSTPSIDPNTKTHPTVYIVFGSLLLDLLAFTMILPLLPSLLEYYRLNDKAGLYHTLSTSVRYFQELVGAPEKYNSVLFGGFLGSMYSFLQFVASPIMGGLSDSYGRRPILLICLVSGAAWLDLVVMVLCVILSPSADWHSEFVWLVGDFNEFRMVCVCPFCGRLE